MRVCVVFVHLTPFNIINSFRFMFNMFCLYVVAKYAIPLFTLSAFSDGPTIPLISSVSVELLLLLVVGVSVVWFMFYTYLNLHSYRVIIIWFTVNMCVCENGVKFVADLPLPKPETLLRSRLPVLKYIRVRIHIYGICVYIVEYTDICVSVLGLFTFSGIIIVWNSKRYTQRNCILSS